MEKTFIPLVSYVSGTKFFYYFCKYTERCALEQAKAGFLLGKAGMRPFPSD